MSVPAEKLDMLFKDLMEKANKSSEEFNIISFEEYKKANKNKIALLNILKNFVVEFNTEYKLSSFKRIATLEINYLIIVYLKSKNLCNNLELYISELNKFINLINENIKLTEAFIDIIKIYPNKKLKTTSLKIDEETYKVFKYFKKRITEINDEIEKNNFAPPQYMESALEKIDPIINKILEYQDRPRAILDLFAYFYADLEDLEWTDEDREYVRKHYTSSED